jgi:pseudouridine kinase
MLDDGGVYYFSDQEDGHLLPIKTVGIDVTGTNDALAACVIYGLMNGETLRRACQLGLAGAALTLETDESIAGNLKPDEIYRIAGRYFGF